MILRTAQHVRQSGHPDWVQFIALMYAIAHTTHSYTFCSYEIFCRLCLGRIAYFPILTQEVQRPPLPRDRSEDPGAGYRQWALGGLSWVLSHPLCPHLRSPPTSVLEHLKSAVEESDSEEESEQKQSVSSSSCSASQPRGLNHAQVVWGPYEYIYHWMHRNGCTVPREGGAMVSVSICSCV
jgi:hypothetical protein